MNDPKMMAERLRVLLEERNRLEVGFLKAENQVWKFLGSRVGGGNAGGRGSFQLFRALEEAQLAFLKSNNAVFEFLAGCADAVHQG